MKNKIMVLLAIFVLITGTCSPIETKTYNDDLTYFRSITEKWNQDNYSGDAKIEEIIPIVDYYDSIVGVLLSFSQNGKAAGFVSLSLFNDQEIGSFALDGLDPYLNCINIANEKGLKVPTEKKVVSIDLNFFSVEVQCGEEKAYLEESGRVKKCDFLEDEDFIKEYHQYLSDHCDTPLPLFADYLSITQYGKGFPWNQYISSISGAIVDSHIITGGTSFTPFVMADMPPYDSSQGLTAGAAGEGNCGPTALLNVVGYYKTQRGKTNLYYGNSWYDSYVLLRNASNYTPAAGMNENKIQNAYTTYGTYTGYSIWATKYSIPSWNNYKQSLDNDKPIIVLVGGFDANLNYEGHYVVAIGYFSYASGGYSHYLRVYDGWYANSNRCLAFVPSAFSVFHGYAITVL